MKVIMFIRTKFYKITMFKMQRNVQSETAVYVKHKIWNIFIEYEPYKFVLMKSLPFN